MPIALAVLFALFMGVNSAHAAAVTIAWDGSSDPTVVGYRVYVGTTPGFYTETFDVGKATSFSYEAIEQRTYYFAVAAYAAGPRIGPLSAEVSTSLGAVAPSNPLAAAFWSSLWKSQAQATRVTRSDRCWTPGNADCVIVQTIARVEAAISSLAATSDGRVLFVEGGRRVRVVTPAGLVSEPALVEPNGAVTLNELAIDPTFSETGWIWVSETETSADGRREFRVARYRVVQNRAGERVGTIAGIP
jgi:hypothetical protein